MDRRSFLQVISAVTLVVATPLRYISEPVYQWVEEAVSFDTLVSDALARRVPAMVENIQRNNELIARLQKRIANTEADIQRQLDESVWK